MGIFFTWILFSFVVGAIGSSRTTGFLGGFLLSILLSPLIGIIIVLSSKRKDTIAFEKALLEKKDAPSEESYIDELYKLQKLMESNVIDQEFYEKERERIEGFRLGRRKVSFYDSKGRNLKIRINKDPETVKVGDNIEEAISFSITTSKFTLTVIPNTILQASRSFQLNANKSENIYNISDLI